MVTTTFFPALTDNSWEYVFGSPSATLAVLIAIPVVIILIVTIASIYAYNRRKKNTGGPRRRHPPNSMISDHEVIAPLNMNANNGGHSGQYINGSASSYNKIPLTVNGEHRFVDKCHQPPTYRSGGLGTPQQYSQYYASDGSYRSSLHYPPAAGVPQVNGLHPQQHGYLLHHDIPDSDSHFSSVSHTRPQYMNNTRNPYDDRDIHSDPPHSRVGADGHMCPPPPPGSYYSEQW